MPSNSTADFLGDTAWLHSSTVDIKITRTLTGVQNSEHFRLSTSPEITKYTDSRALARILGTVKFSIRGPTSASKSTTGTAVVVPYDLDSWPQTNAETAKAALSQDVVSSLYLDKQFADLEFHEAVNTILKPTPLAGKHPAIVWSYLIEGGAQADRVRLEVSLKLELNGVDYVSPW